VGLLISAKVLLIEQGQLPASQASLDVVPAV
jgi:hypothetical protein